MKQVLRFLHSLSLHNDRTWFEVHKADYLKAKGTVAALAERLIAGIRSFDSGYYFHIDGGGNHLLAVGNYFTEPRVLKVLREDIELGGGDFRRILEGLAPGLALETESALKKVPKGFPADSPDAEFFKLRNFCLVENLDDSFILSQDLADRLLAIFQTAKPFLDYVNRAIDYCREERKEYFSSVDVY